jgi:hypothetical protein
MSSVGGFTEVIGIGEGVTRGSELAIAGIEQGEKKSSGYCDASK